MDSETGLSTAPSRRKRICGYIFDILILIIFIILVCVFESKKRSEDRGGFYCNDPNLSHHYTEETIKSKSVLLLAYILPLLMVLITELVMNTRHEYTFKEKLIKVLISTGIIYMYFFCGAVMTMVVCQICMVLRMPRPVFFEVCKPDTGLTCKGSEYVSEYTCTSGYSWWMQEDASRSFPSTHAALSLYSELFMLWYLQRRAVKSYSYSTLAVPALQMLCVVFAISCSVPSITENWHHWWDVLFGFIIALLTVFYTCYVVMNNFNLRVLLRRTHDDDDD